ncbi:MAG: hypothetical protein ABID09_00365 [Candidatus Omnitrophota bacterium]
MATLLLYVIGILWIVSGALLVFAPDVLRKNLFNKFKKMNLKRISIVPIIVGILLLFSASQHRYTFLIILLGLLAIAKGFYGILATDKATKFMNWWIDKAGSAVYRVHGILAIILGSIVLVGI